MKSARLTNSLWFGICALAIAWLLVTGTPYENTLWLAATGKVDLGLSLFYRFRDSTIVTDGTWGGPGLGIFLGVCSLIGVRSAWSVTIVLQAFLLHQKSLKIKIFSAALLVAALLWGEALLVWNLLFTLLVHVFGRIAAPRNLRAVLITLVALAGFLGAVELPWVMGNPARSVTRQRVLGGKSHFDVLKPQLRRPAIILHESCLAVLNPDDLRGVQSTELLSRSSLANFEAVILLDLKIVEMNYRFLTMKDEKGEFVFSNAARNFAEKEKAHAAAVRARLESAKNLCLIAPFDLLPDQEAPPYSRAREILDARRKAGLPTRVIQLGGA
ncbi:MAG TPA: hypothetical protein PKI36_07230 [Turneriella sp.]|nr:hypothetical protein [Turneriella sp.]